jgi:DNA-directed RNA polymerase subunit RPC12/RpoP
MTQRVRCTRCQTAFLTAEDQPGQTVECPKCGARRRLPELTKPVDTAIEPDHQAEVAEPAATVFVPSPESTARSSRRRWLLAFAALAVALLAGVAGLILWPRLRPHARATDPVERLADDYLQALVNGDLAAQQRLSTVEDPPAIRSFQSVRRDSTRNRTIKGSFAPLAALHTGIESEFNYDPAIARFTPKHPLGAAAATLDAVHAAKEKAEKSGIYEKMASGDPNDIFDAAENFGKVFTQLAEGALAPKRILPTYTLLVDDARPPVPSNVKELASSVAESPKTWDALLKRPFHTLKADGPFILDQAEVDAQVTDQLASLGDPPTTMRLSLIRFRLEGIDTAWRVTAAKRIGQGNTPEAEPQPSTGSPDVSPSPSPGSDSSSPRSLGRPGTP